MNIQEFYAVVGGNYESVVSRLMNEGLVKRFVYKFLSDASYGQLEEAMQQKDFGLAFRMVHTLKGLSQNLGFDKLSDSASNMTETLRKWESEGVDEASCDVQWKQVSADYHMVVETIHCLQESES